MIRTMTTAAAIFALAIPAAATAQERYAAVDTTTMEAPAPASMDATSTGGADDRPIAMAQSRYYADDYVFVTPSYMAYDVPNTAHPRDGSEEVLSANAGPTNLRPEDAASGV